VLLRGDQDDAAYDRIYKARRYIRRLWLLGVDRDQFCTSFFLKLRTKTLQEIQIYFDKKSHIKAQCGRSISVFLPRKVDKEIPFDE